MELKSDTSTRNLDGGRQPPTHAAATVNVAASRTSTHWEDAVNRANAALTEQKPSVALKAAQEALEIARNIFHPNDYRQITSNKLLGLALVASRNYTSAREAFQAALRTRIMVDNASHHENVELHHHIGETSLLLDDPRAALQAFKCVSDIHDANSSTDTIDKMIDKFNLARAYKALGETSNSTRCMLEAFSMVDRVPSKSSLKLVEALSTLGYRYMNQRDYNNAAAVYAYTISFFEKMGLSGDSILPILRNNLSYALRALDKFDEALKELEQASSQVKATVQIKDDPEQALRPRRLMISLHSEAGHILKGERVARENLEMVRNALNGNRQIELVPFLLDATSACVDSCKFLEAEEFVLEAYKLLKDEEPSSHLAEALQHLGHIAMFKHDEEKAEEFLGQALLIYQKCEVSSVAEKSAGGTRLNMAQIHLAQERIEEARTLLEEAITDLFPTSLADDNHGYAACLRLQGEIEMHEGNTTKAEELFLRSLERHENLCATKDRFILVPTLYQLGAYYQHIGNYDESKKYFERTKHILTSCGREIHPIMVNTLQNLAELYDQEGDTDTATQLRTQATASIHEFDRLNNGFVLKGLEGPEEELEL